jgi:hypothetical protein
VLTLPGQKFAFDSGNDLKLAGDMMAAMNINP